ncbi:hypothetical protein Acj9p216 [Acinetobacter phage Acj9]|uniref:Conserved hypothetical phage protein n=1 Tax=Acinetobacter phage Acj9 TaxID=760939 RepID=E5EQ00_9CAUD|nr:hypothetical protein Acj9p216 [Acinetobacter phage Acj9]ADG60116.1 conserved hypothetical phage protein [Acinetobacter phage Acj9]
MSVLYSKLFELSNEAGPVMSEELCLEFIDVLDERTNAKKLMQEHNCDAFLLMVPGYCTGGRIFFDKNCRFPDGTLVRTSTVQDVKLVDAGFTVMQTRNTRYLTLG